MDYTDKIKQYGISLRPLGAVGDCVKEILEHILHKFDYQILFSFNSTFWGQFLGEMSPVTFFVVIKKTIYEYMLKNTMFSWGTITLSPRGATFYLSFPG